MSDQELPVGIHISYSQQYRRCNKPDCLRCRGDGPGHGPYWFAYWREGGRLRSRYLGRTPPAQVSQSLPAGPMAGAIPAAPQVRTLGGFALWSGERLIPVEARQARKALTLFKCLLSAPHQRAHREYLPDLLWPELPPEKGPRNLRLVIYRLRRLLHEQAIDIDCVRVGDELQIVSRTGAPAPAWLDAVAFEQAARAARAGQDLARCRAALALYSGEYLPEDRYADWAQARREELRQLYLSVLLHLARLRERAGVLGETARCLRRVLALDPCHEQAAQSLMRVLARSGRRTEALRVYQHVATSLERDLQLQPERHTQELYRRLLEQETPSLPQTNLPTPLTSFVGREQDLATLTATLIAAAAPDAGHARFRLVTLAGPGGCGKTRLAVELGHELLATYAQGVWYIDLAPIRSMAAAAQPEDAVRQVSTVVARVLDLREDPGCSLLDTAAQALRDRHALLILDNCEHLVAACVTVVATLLTRCPRLCVLATSREALAMQGEALWRVQPLAVPAPTESGDADVLASFPAPRLFVERARGVRPTFTLDPRTCPAVQEICRRLDGVPLAIELAAACLGSLTVHEIAARLDDRFRLLVMGNRAAAPRHQTLQAALEWSYSLLHATEQTVLCRLAVFAGGWTLAAAEAVCADEAIDAAVMLPRLTRLVTKSLVQQTDDLEESRFSLLETVRHYGWERLSPAERQTVHARHLAWCLALAEQAEPKLTGAEQTSWLQRLEREHDNVRAALAWSLQDAPGTCLPAGYPASRQGLRLANALRPFWRLRGHLHEGRHWLKLALTADDGAQPLVRAGVLLAAGGLAHLQGDGADACSLKQQALALFEEQGDQGGVAESKLLLASEVYLAGEAQRARQLLEQALALFQRLAQPQGQTAALNYLAGMAHDQSDYARAETLYTEGLDLSRQVGDQRGIGVTLHNLGCVALDRGDVARARPLLEESLRVRRALGERWGIARSLNTLGDLAQVRRVWTEAAALYEEALTIFRALGARRDVCQTLHSLGQVAYHLGDTARAQPLAQESLALAEEWGFRKQAGYAQYLLGSLARRAGDLAQAQIWDAAGARCHQSADFATGYILGIEGIAATATLLGHTVDAVMLYAAATAWRAAQREPRWPTDEQQYAWDTETLRAQLGKVAFAAAWQAGSALTPAQALDRALALATGHPRGAS